MEAESKSFILLRLLTFFPFFLIFDNKKARAGKLAESQELEAKSRRIPGVKSWKLKTSGHMKKLKAKSFIIDGKAESQKRKFYHTAFQLCLV